MWKYVCKIFCFKSGLMFTYMRAVLVWWWSFGYECVSKGSGESSKINFLGYS